jgi:hypothetical protein
MIRRNLKKKSGLSDKQLINYLDKINELRGFGEWPETAWQR